MIEIKAVEIHDNLLKKEYTEIVFIKNKKMYFSPLFWIEDDCIEKKILKVLKNVTIEIEDEEYEIEKMIEIYISLASEFDLNICDNIEKIMKHWQYINGFSSISFKKKINILGRHEVANF